ncbi:capsular polysaccharide synthesis protein [Micromonosporaceae bacterium Da 78-11]
MSRLVRVFQPAPALVSVLNLVPDPGFRGPGEDLYVHGHNSGEPAEVPGPPGITGVRVVGVSGNNDTHIAPGGRNADGEFQLGMRPGATYTASVSVFLPEPLTGALNIAALRIIPGCQFGDVIKWTVAHSRPARNEFGHHRISVTFTVPAKATAAWIRLHCGMSRGHGEVYWHSFTLTETDWPVDHFDGSTPGDDFYAYEWTGAPNASPSRRTLRVAEGVSPAAIVTEAVRQAAAGAHAQARALLAVLGDDRAAEARAAEARVQLAAAQRGSGSEAAARKALARTGGGAYELGLLALRDNSAAAAEKLLGQALDGSPERAYALAAAYDKLKRRADSKRTSAAGLAHDHGLPFDGPAVLDLDVKSFGARRELGIFLAKHLDQIRVQAEQRLAWPVATTLDQPIFIYWAQGFTAAPPLVRTCLAQLRATNPDASVHELTDETIGNYVDIPPDITALLGDNKTHFSDLLRLVLLEKYGGVWVDGTCYVTEPLRPHIDRALEQGSVFAFNYHGPYISNWLLAAGPGSYAMHLWRAASFLWWELRGELIDYFLHHHIFEMLHHLDPRFRADWDAGLRLSSKPPHALQAAMLNPYETATFRAMLGGSFAHKLRYKYQPDEVTSESYLAHLIRNDLP